MQEWVNNHNAIVLFIGFALFIGFCGLLGYLRCKQHYEPTRYFRERFEDED